MRKHFQLVVFAGSELVFANPHPAVETLGLIMGTKHCANVKVGAHRQPLALGLSHSPEHAYKITSTACCIMITL